jgi:ABC-type branched-subunit amino acid transport system ATPase component
MCAVCRLEELSRYKVEQRITAVGSGEALAFAQTFNPELTCKQIDNHRNLHMSRSGTVQPFQVETTFSDLTTSDEVLLATLRAFQAQADRLTAQVTEYPSARLEKQLSEVLSRMSMIAMKVRVADVFQTFDPLLDGGAEDDEG